MASTMISQTERASRDGPDAANRRLFRAIGDFFAAHHLHPSPENYALVYMLMTAPNSPVAQAITAATSDGLRLSQSDADRIRRESGLAADDLLQSGVALAGAEAISDARRQVEAFSSIVEATKAEAEAYGRDLAAGAAELNALGPAAPQVVGLVRITGAMMERTRSAESQLQAAREEAQELREKLAEAEEEARSDPLTRLPNRRAFEDRLAELVAGGGTVSLALCDVDHFKVINDTHGHGVGDRVLRMVADVLRTSCEGHMVARVGGEEFVVLFDGLAAAEAAAVMDDARAALAARHFKVRGTDAPLGQVTFSAGIAACAAGDTESPLKRADTLLYEAKNSGRNKVVAEGR